MKAGFARVVESTRLYGETYVTWFDAPELLAGAQPGQFVMLRCAADTGGAAALGSASLLSSDPLLPRAMSYHRLRDGAHGKEFSILYDVVGRGTAWLAARQPGDAVYAWGPLGRGFSLRDLGQNLLLVGGGIGIAPLLWLADEVVQKGKSVVLLDGARSEQAIFPAELLPPEVEMAVATEDGSAGQKGLVTDVFLDYFAWADQVFCCGPNPMFAGLGRQLQEHEGGQRARRRKSVQALLESSMGCGTGICYGCAVFDRRDKARLVCKDGPRFELREIW